MPCIRLSRLMMVAGLASLTACSMERPTTPATASAPQLSGMLAPCQQTDTGCVDPMLIIDGKVSAYKDLDLRGVDVESIEVLKGELARERYGEAGRHGVIVITTKRASGKI